MLSLCLPQNPRPFSPLCLVFLCLILDCVLHKACAWHFHPLCPQLPDGRALQSSSQLVSCPSGHQPGPGHQVLSAAGSGKDRLPGGTGPALSPPIRQPRQSLLSCPSLVDSPDGSQHSLGGQPLSGGPMANPDGVEAGVPLRRQSERSPHVTQPWGSRMASSLPSPFPV